MENQEQQKKQSFFFAYGSPQFVLGATLLNLFLNSDSNTRKNVMSGIVVSFVTIVIAVLIIFGGIKVVNFFSTPSYSVNGYFSSSDWEKWNGVYTLKNDSVEFMLYPSQIDSLPNPTKLKNVLDNSIEVIKNKTKGFKLKKIKMEFLWVNAFPQLRHCLVVDIDYHSAEGKDDFVWNGKEYVAAKIDGDLNKKFEFDTYKLK